MKIVRRCTALSCWLIGCAAAAFSIAALGGPVTFATFPAGALPEAIVPVPAGFGGASGTLFVPDPTRNFVGTGTIWSVPAGGGSPSPFASGLVLQPIGGIFLPPNYGSLAGQFLAAGRFLGAGSTSNVVAFDSTGHQTQIGAGIGPNSFADVAIAPAGFDSAGGQIVLANEGGEIFTLGTNGSTFSVLTGGVVPGNPFGLGFAPSGFGAVGGDLLITDSASGAIYALSPSGALNLFADIPLGIGQSGLRQLAFAPAGSPFAGDLFVSVSGSNAGGGIAGSVDVLSPSGLVIAFLARGTVGAPYDPRGIYFLDSTHFLISDADPSIIEASTSDLTPGSPATVPEPATLALLAIGLAGLGVSCRRKLN